MLLIGMWLELVICQKIEKNHVKIISIIKIQVIKNKSLHRYAHLWIH